MPLTAGTRLGPYEIVGPLGAGGMGEVYRARDSRLNREVALKILPPELASDPSRRQRFEQEARIVAALNHPNIVAVYDVGEGYIVSELVDGESLRGAKFGLRKTIDIAVQIAEGLAAAHAAGITHRDLKPENILLTREGRVKILDFGLAKVHIAPAMASSETVTVRTDPGVVMGTVGYMSPEQVRGLEVDQRSDLFSFGVILHELLSGERPFRGDTAVEIMTAILKQDAPDLPETIPAGIRQVIAHSLEKEPRDRFQSARDMRFALAAMSQTGAAPVLAQKRRWPLWPVFVLFLLAIGVAAFIYLRRVPNTPEWSGMMLGGPEIATTVRVSPDGNLLAFLAMVDGQTQAAVMKPESGNWTVLTRDRSHGVAIQIAWSPDGTLLYYDRVTDVPSGIYSVPVLGGEERLVLENAGLLDTVRDGSLLVIRVNPARQRQLFRYWPDSGRLQEFAIEFQFFREMCRAFPDGTLAVAGGRTIGSGKPDWHLLVIDLGTGKVRRLSENLEDRMINAIAVAPDGKYVLAALPSGSLRRIVSIPISGAAPIRTLFTVHSDVWQLQYGPDGSIFANLVDRPMVLWRLTAHGGIPQEVKNFPPVTGSQYLTPGLSILSDGRVVIPAFVAGHTRLMVWEENKSLVPLIAGNEESAAPFSVTGPHQIAFAIGPEPRQTIGIADVATGRITRRIALAKGPISGLASSSDGKTLYCAAGGTVWAVSATGGDPRRIRDGESVMIDPAGRYLVVETAESERTHLFQVPLAGGPEREIPLDTSIPIFPIPISSGSISADSRMVLPLATRDSWFNPAGILDLASGRITQIPSSDRHDHPALVWLPDGRVLSLAVGIRANIWKFTPDGGAK
jgi:predicted Ser/Thr protein kinase/WD40 repeat protein